MANVSKGIDVSSHQGAVAWDKVKNNIDFAILRCGYGNDIVKQDDAQFKRNIAECVKRNIPYAVYIYSYATTDSMIDSEAAHVLRLIKGYDPFCVYIDMEDKSTVGLGKAKLTAFADRFCKKIKASGYKTGVYANLNWFKNYLDAGKLKGQGYSLWCARYSDDKPDIGTGYDIWQYSSSGKVEGISGNVDMNYMYTNLTEAEKKPPIYIVRKSWRAKTVMQTKYISQARIVARKYKYVIYDEKGKTIYSYR